MVSGNTMELTFPGISQNEAFARVCAAAFAARLDPTLDEVADIKTALSEAVTNCIVHAYGKEVGPVTLRGEIIPGGVAFSVEDSGIGIADIALAMQPFYSTAQSEERSGMGFTVMQAFMDEVTVQSAPGKGTKVRLVKYIPSRANRQA